MDEFNKDVENTFKKLEEWMDSPEGQEYFRKLEEREQFIKTFINTPEFEQAWFNLLIDLNNREGLQDMQLHYEKDCITTPQMLVDMVSTILVNNLIEYKSEQDDNGLFWCSDESVVYKGLKFYRVDGQGTLYGVTKVQQKTA